LDLPSALRKVPGAGWKTFGQEEDGTLRQWAEVDFVPGDSHEQKKSHPLRHVGLRLLKPQGELFADGSDRHYHAVVTNQRMEGGRLLEWHEEKAGTVEYTHDEVKNQLGGGHGPSQRFGVNSAWFKITLLTYNLVSAIKGLCLEGEEQAARLKKFSAAGDSSGRADEPEQLCDGVAALPERRRTQAAADDLEGV
jgi:hypothetical protein